MTTEDMTDPRLLPLRQPAAERRAARAAWRRPLGFGTGGDGGRHVGVEILGDVEHHWQQARGTAWVPRRSDFDPDAIASALPAVMILERVAPGIARIRVAGQQIVQAAGQDPRGMPLSVFFSPAARRPLGAHIESAFAGPAIVSLPVTTPRRLLRAGTTGRLLILPLDDGSGQITRALAVLVTDAPTGRHGAVRFDIPGDETPRISVVPAPRVLRHVPRRWTRSEPSVTETIARRRSPGAMATGSLPVPEVVTAMPTLRPFQVIRGDATARPVRDDTNRPALSLVVSND